jgi:uncharacterized peroxidase-related enzyme
MSWITSIPAHEAEDRLKTLYTRIAGPNGQVDNILTAHGLRPHTLEGHMALYKAVLHHFGNSLDKSYLETIGTYVSMLNNCAYCVEHHFAGLQRLIGDDARANDIRDALEIDQPARAFGVREAAGLLYARKLTREPASVREADIISLRKVGFSDGEILEINQVSAYFSYANRTVLGLGVSHENEDLGLSPGDGDDPKNWSHA